MKALRYLTPGVAKTENIKQPACGEDEALIRVHSAGICGTDLAIYAGKHPRAKAPLVMGHEFAGEIVEINSSEIHSDLAVGDKVTVYPLLVCGQCWACKNGVSHVCRDLKLIGIDRDGAFAEFVNVPLDLIFRYPEELTYDQGALIEPLAVAVHAVEMAGETDWQTAVVIGSGPIGLLVALCLRHAGIDTIIISDINPHRLKRSEKLGLKIFNSAEGDLVDFVNATTRDEGADIVFECAGSSPAALQASALVRPRGKVIVVSTHKEPHAVDLQRINFREITMIGTRVYTRNSYQKALQMIKDLPFDNLISHRLDIDDAAEGFELMQRPEDVCKVIINTN
ncbi:MAG: alcohol dehydrogenase catalytic domain-containing protein [Desulfobacterales bacterium]|jgi:2-desacetyl-2-hydroxyethyl bacteriochlorophyllide A dehydrogenase